MLEAVFQSGERQAALTPHAQHHTRGPEPDNTLGIEPTAIFDEPVGNPQHRAERLGRQLTDARYPGDVWWQVPGVQPATWTAHLLEDRHWLLIHQRHGCGFEALCGFGHPSQGLCQQIKTQTADHVRSRGNDRRGAKIPCHSTGKRIRAPLMPREHGDNEASSLIHGQHPGSVVFATRHGAIKRVTAPVARKKTRWSYCVNQAVTCEARAVS